ncbi:MAG: tetratricopeptide repeat protein [Chitinophagaceae bacterium]|nr:tetratricopeptide repeat protein [Chitinophagaceae bacterium]
MKKILFFIFIISCLSLQAQTQETPESLSDWLTEYGANKADKGDFTSAIEAYNKALEWNPKNNLAFYNRAVAKHNLKDYKGAISDYTKAIQLSQNNADAFYGRGVCWGSIGEIEKACIDLNNAASLGNKEAQSHKSILCK